MVQYGLERGDESSGDESSHSSSSSGSGGGHGSPPVRSRSGSRSSGKSGSKSPTPRRSRSRSRSSAGSGSRVQRGSGSSSEGSPARSGSRSRSRSRSRSKSSGRSGSKSPGSKRSRSGSKSPSRSRSRSRSNSHSGSEAAIRTVKIKRDADAKTRGSSSERSTGAPSPINSERSGSHVSRSRSNSGERSGDETKVKKEAEVVPNQTQLFGDADDISDDDDDDKRSGGEEEKKDDKSDKSDKSDTETKAKDDDDDEQIPDEREEEQEGMEVEEEQMPETRIDVEIPKITSDLGKVIHFVKLPNFLSVETRPFDPQTYEDEIDEEETLDEEGRARLKLKVENTIRWRERFNENNVFVKESNARFVRWSDGSLSLHLGSEIFNVHKQPLQGDHNHLFIRQGTGLQGQAVFRTKLTFRPHSTESFTHRKMTMSLADRSQKTSGIKVLSMVGHDPEAQRSQMIKKEEDMLRASVRRENTQRRVRERITSRGLSTSYLEPDRYENDEFSDEDNAISLSAIKNRYKKNAKMHQNIYSSDDDDDDDEGVRVTKKSDKPKRIRDSDEESDNNAGAARSSPKAAASRSGSGSD